VVTPLEAPPLNVVLVNPLEALSTTDVFRKFDELGLGADFAERPAPRWRTAEDAADGARAWGNDLAAPAARITPVIQDIVSALTNDCRVTYASLSGSGATCFGIVRHEAEAASLAAEIALRRPDWWVKSAKLGALDPSAAQL
jgi:4-diphosphocytidyl-2-C-methyl-D-erythritol kinase